MPQTKPIVSIENVVASASVDQRIDLNVITQTFPDVEYHPDQFPGLVFRIKSPKTATLIFSSGKMVCTGSKSEEQAVKAVRSVVQALRKGGIASSWVPSTHLPVRGGWGCESMGLAVRSGLAFPWSRMSTDRCITCIRFWKKKN